MKRLIATVIALTLVATSALAAYINPPVPVSKGGTGSTSQTASRVVTTDGSGNLVSSSGVTSTEVGYLSGVTSAIQTQLGGKLSSSLTTNHIFVGSSGVATDVAMSGDATIAASGALTLANSGVSAGSYTIANITVDAKGRVTAASNGSLPAMTVANGGDAAYTILAGDGLVRSGTTLTANRTYTLPACTSNLGELHTVKNVAGQGFNVILAPNGSDTIDGLSSVTLSPGDAVDVICAASAKWDIK